MRELAATKARLPRRLCDRLGVRHAACPPVAREGANCSPSKCAPATESLEANRTSHEQSGRPTATGSCRSEAPFQPHGQQLAPVDITPRCGRITTLNGHFSYELSCITVLRPPGLWLCGPRRRRWSLGRSLTGSRSSVSASASHRLAALSEAKTAPNPHRRPGTRCTQFSTSHRRPSRVPLPHAAQKGKKEAPWYASWLLA